VALGAMVQRVRALWLSAFVRCGSALIRTASSVVDTLTLVGRPAISM
jgi:hypothetical protein